MEYSKESRDRIEKIKQLKEAGVIVYANHFSGKQNIIDIRNSQNLKNVDDLMEKGAIGEVKTAGRLMSFKSHGKLSFGRIIDDSNGIQICFVRDKILFNPGNGNIVENMTIGGQEISAYKIIEKMCYVGDYIGVIGDLFITQHGELTIFVKEFQILSKAIRPMPEKWHGIKDIEDIYRQRYLDLISNEESFERMKFRSNFLRSIREFYYQEGFTEIETPILGNSASGAAAKPFTTHHNDFDEDFFLRISPETALKKATVGRFEKVFEVARNFRNEGSDPSHMQEFTSIEHYSAYWNFEDNMNFTEKMFDYIFSHLKLSNEVNITDKDGNTRLVNFKTPWQRIDYIEGVKNASGIDVTDYGMNDADRLRADIKAKGFSFEGMDKMGTTTLIDYLYKKVLRPAIVGPAFVYNYPKTMQPLARQSDENPNIVEQFQVVIMGWEVIKAYSELVDPEIQKANFEEQTLASNNGDDEATSADDDFVLAMEYGMPCQSGWGMGVDRIVSLITGQPNLRDVVLFPIMKTQKHQNLQENDEK